MKEYEVRDEVIISCLLSGFLWENNGLVRFF